MDLFFGNRSSCFFRKDSVFVLAFAWISGLVAGLLSLFSADDVTTMIHTALLGRVSFCGLFLSVIIPLLISAYALYSSNLCLLIPVVFLKAFLISFFSCGVLIVFGCSGWLVCTLFLFSDICMLPVFWLFWLHSIRQCQSMFFYGTASALSAAVLIGCIDYSVISPFLGELISL